MLSDIEAIEQVITENALDLEQQILLMKAVIASAGYGGHHNDAHIELVANYLRSSINIDNERNMAVLQAIVYSLGDPTPTGKPILASILEELP